MLFLVKARLHTCYLYCFVSVELDSSGGCVELFPTRVIEKFLSTKDKIHFKNIDFVMFLWKNKLIFGL